MLLLAIGARPDLTKALNEVAIDDATLLSYAPEGFDIEFADNLETALALIKESSDLLRPVDLAIVDGPYSFESAASLLEISSLIRIAVVGPSEGSLCPQALIMKRPLLPGEVEATVRKLIELRWGSRAFDGLFNASSSMTALVSASGQVASWNSSAVAGTGISVKDAVGAQLWELFPFLKGHESLLARALETSTVQRMKHIFVGKAGSDEKYYDVKISPMSSCLEAVVSVDDVTTDVKKDEHLRQAQKMDSVGSLAAGLAHDFNNVIGGVEATMSSIRFSIDSEAEAARLNKVFENDFDLVDESVKRGKGIVSQLMALSIRKEMPFSPADLNAMVEDVIRICKNTFPQEVKVEFTPAAERPSMVMAYPTQIEQSILNLCINASHSMTIMRPQGEPQGGTLSLSVTKIEVGANITSVMPEAEAGEYWLLTVSDTGVGMTREIMQRIFEPFFTTKDVGSGSGLGLAMVYNIIRQHKGFIDIFSEPGAGSSFLLFLPAMKGDGK